MKTNHIHCILALAMSASAPAKPPNDRVPQGPPPQGPPLFMVLDTNRDGVLADDEIKAAAEIIAKLDKNHDGRITIEELRMPPPPRDEDGPKGPPPPDGKRPIPPLINALDADRNGTISAQEMANAPESLKALDKNGDGELSPDELRPPGPPPGDRHGPQGPPPPDDGGAAE